MHCHTINYHTMMDHDGPSHPIPCHRYHTLLCRILHVLYSTPPTPCARLHVPLSALCPSFSVLSLYTVPCLLHLRQLLAGFLHHPQLLLQPHVHSFPKCGLVPVPCSLVQCSISLQSTRWRGIAWYSRGRVTLTR